MKYLRSLIPMLVVGLLTIFPIHSASAAAGLASDDFNLACGVLGAEWTIVDPLADGSFQLAGVGTGDAQLQIGVPGGVEHHLWSDGLTSPMLMQAATDEDFEVEVKFTSIPSVDIQTQGIAIEGADGEVIRFDFFVRKGNLRVLAAVVDGTSATTIYSTKIGSASGELYMRVSRTGDTWTQLYSFDGSAWSTAGSFDVAMLLTGVGLYAGNSGAVPGYTAVVDYFFDTSAPIAPEDGADVAVPGPKTLGITVAGTGAGSVTRDPDSPEYACGASVSVTATPAAGSNFAGWSGDVVSNDNPLSVSMGTALDLVATFDLIAEPPVISNVTSVATGGGVTVSWVTDYPATSILDYGETTGYELGTAFNNAFVTSHSLELTGLLPDTLHHYQLVSFGEGTGLAGTSDDLTFTTTIAPDSASNIFSDDFNHACGDLAPGWTTIDPLGDATFDSIGIGTDDAQLRITVPAGVEHDAWTDGLSVPRIVQPMDDTDFEIETRFESVLAASIQGQGIILEDGAGAHLRFDFSHNDGKLRIFAAKISDGVGFIYANEVIPAGSDRYMRVSRVGDLWTQQYSADGINWVTAASVNLTFGAIQVGVFALNSGTNPAHTAVVDYFFNTSAPIASEDGSVTGDPSPRSLNLNAAPGGSVSADPDLPSYFCDDVVSLTATPDVGFAFESWMGDIASAQNPLVVTLTTDLDLTATFVPDAAPAISNLIVVPGLDAATISWTTDVPTTSVVNYGPTAVYENGAVTNLTLETAHNVVLNGLASETQYHFDASGASSSGSLSSTGDQTFTTAQQGFDPSGIVGDDFNSDCGVIGGQWTFFDPSGDSNLSLIGLGTDDARALIDVPAGAEHNLSASNSDAPRILQPINNGDFEIEAKFDSELSVGTQGQGIIIQASPSEFLRFSIFHSGKKLRTYAGYLSGGTLTTVESRQVPYTAPYYIRVKRFGDEWTQSVSDDGISWFEVVTFTHGLLVSDVGVYALTAKNLPAHTAAVDYFVSTATPVVPEDGPTSGGGAKTLETFLVGNGSITVDPDLVDYACGQPVVLTADADFGSVFTGWTGDVVSSDNPLFLSMVANRSVTANFEFDADPPVISDLEHHAGAKSALITWTTNEPATSVVDYGPTAAYENGTVSDSAMVLGHSIRLTGLVPESTYHYRVTTVDANGVSSDTSDITFTTGTDGGPSGIVSDDFANNNLDIGVWTITDPLADSGVEIRDPDTTDALLELNIPANTEHSVTASSPTAPRILQATADTDLRIDTKIEQDLSGDYQAQGIWVEASPGEFITFDRHTSGFANRLAATTHSARVESVEIDIAIPTLSVIYLRVERLGDDWVFSYSTDGITFVLAGSFNHAMAVSATGVFAATESAGGASPAFSSSFDFYFDTDTPIVPEDSGASADVLPPLVHGVTTSESDTSVELRWTTDEPATSEVFYGPTTAYEDGSVFAGSLVRDHVMVLSGLNPDTTYHVNIVSEDALAQSGESGDFEITTFFLGYSGGPEIAVWYGGFQRFGHVGLSQKWVNILGNVSDADGLASIAYTLNGSAPRALSIGPDGRRLADPGDFNADILVTDMLQGNNTVVITALDVLGNESTRVVVVEFDGNAIPPLPRTIDWSNTSEIQDVAQAIDGFWAIEGDTVRAQQLDYDRLLGVGDVSYTDYEVTAPVTIHAIDPGGFNNTSGKPGLGIMLRWPGHTVRNNDQPATGIIPLGGIGWLRWKINGITRLGIYANTGENSTRFTVQFGETYMVKMRVETVPGVGGLYSVKMWQQGTAEPAGWIVTRQETLADPQDGAPVLVSHHVDASWGTVEITEIP